MAKENVNGEGRIKSCNCEEAPLMKFCVSYRDCIMGRVGAGVPISGVIGIQKLV